VLSTSLVPSTSSVRARPQAPQVPLTAERNSPWSTRGVPRETFPGGRPDPMLSQAPHQGLASDRQLVRAVSVRVRRSSVAIGARFAGAELAMGRARRSSLSSLKVTGVLVAAHLPGPGRHLHGCVLLRLSRERMRTWGGTVCSWGSMDARSCPQGSQIQPRPPAQEPP
jgi:hypothetical protein